MTCRHLLTALLALGLAAAWPVPSDAATVTKSVDLELGTWLDLDAKDGEVTVHRVRLVEVTGTITKSDLTRPSGAEYLKTVQFQIEYSNPTTRDWEVRVRIEWLDADGVAIDGYRGDEDLDKREDHDVQTITISTLRYGLAKAKTLEVNIDFGP
ncbi:MAG: hypothetical protein ACOY3Y_05005 [Acidobacteriota bacterium]